MKLVDIKSETMFPVLILGIPRILSRYGNLSVRVTFLEPPLFPSQKGNLLISSPYYPK